MRRLCGPTFARSQDENSEAVLTWWSEAFPARTSATPARAQDSTGSGPACSTTSSEPFATYDPATCFWRTSQPSLFGDSTPFSGRWPKSGLMLAGAAYERPTLARLMAATAGGASRGTASNWPTATVIDAVDGRNRTAGRSNPDSKHHDGVTLSDAIRMWPTPDAGVINDGQDPATFHAWRARMKAKHGNGNGHGTPLAIAAVDVMASAWPTPSVADTMGGHLSRGGDRSEELLLPGMAQRVTENWATPSASEVRQGYQRRPEGMASLQNQQSLSTQVVDSLSGPLAQPIAGRGKPFSLGGRTLRPQLSALFVEWLMGVPLGMTCVCATEGTVSEGLETLSSRNALKRRSGSSGGTHSVSGCEEAR